MEPEQEFLKIHNVYSDPIFRFCFMKVSDRETALDLTQEVFIRAWDYLASGKQVENIKALLYKIASNLVIDYYRKKKESSLEVLTEQGFTPSVSSEVERIHNQLDGREILGLLGKLEPIYREALMLRFVDGLKVKEIAEILDESENNISVRIYRALSQLKKLAKNEEIA